MLTTDLKNFIRSNGFAWPGGYQCALLMADGETIDAQAARENFRQIRETLRSLAKGEAPASRDWQPCTVFIHWEGEALTCAHSGRAIPSTYGND